MKKYKWILETMISQVWWQWQVYSEIKSETKASYKSWRSWMPHRNSELWPTCFEQLLKILWEVTVRSTFLESNIYYNPEDKLNRERLTSWSVWRPLLAPRRENLNSSYNSDNRGKTPMCFKEKPVIQQWPDAGYEVGEYN